MTSKYASTLVRVQEQGNGETAFADADVLFDWVKFEMPRGTAKLVSITGVMKGTNGADANKIDLELYFAKSIDGVAPSTFGPLNDAVTIPIAAAYRRNIIAFKNIDASRYADAEDLLGYNVWGTNSGTVSENPVILHGDIAYDSTGGPGYQTLWVAGIAKGAFDFGTAVALNNSPANQDAAAVETQITTSGGDPRNLFQPGDEVIAQDGAVIGTVVSVDTATTMTVDAVGEALVNGDTINWKYPIELYFNFEY